MLGIGLGGITVMDTRLVLVYCDVKKDFPYVFQVRGGRDVVHLRKLMARSLIHRKASL